MLEGIPALVVTARTTLVGRRERAPATARDASPRPCAAPVAHRPVHFGRWLDTPVYQRTGLLPGMSLDGPAIVQQTDTTTVVEPGMRMRVDGHGNLIVELA